MGDLYQYVERCGCAEGPYIRFDDYSPVARCSRCGENIRVVPIAAEQDKKEAEAQDG